MRPGGPRGVGMEALPYPMRPARCWCGASAQSGLIVNVDRRPHSSTHSFVDNCTKRDPFFNKAHFVNAICTRECQHQLKKSSSSLAQQAFRVAQ